jgi:branched-chain amino acid transport system ATP-binding protein
MVEQNVSLALQVADRGYVLQVGKIILKGERDELMGNEIIKKAFLGG